MNYHSRKERQPPAEHTNHLPSLAGDNKWCLHSQPPSLPFITCTWAEKQQTFQTHRNEAPAGGLWVPGRKQCFWQSITERLPAFVLAPAQAQSAWSRSPEWAEAGLRWGGRGRGLRDTYERRRIQLDFPPSACRYLKTEDAVCFRGNSESTPSYGNSPSSTPPPAPVNPAKTRQSNGSIKSKINLSFRIK